MMKKQLEETGRKTLLAGAGAVQTGKEKAVDKADDFYVTANAFVNGLIERGALVEAELKQKWQEKAAIDEKIAGLKGKLGMLPQTNSQKLAELSEKVDVLLEQVAKLTLQQSEEAQTAPKTPRKAPTKTAADATATTKAAAKKPAAKATTARKTAAPAKPRTRRTVSKPAAED